MPDNLTLSFQITLIGMGLVFGSIILLWGVMELLMKVSSLAARHSGDDLAEREGLAAGEGEAREVLLDRKRRAAAAAVAMALARDNASTVHEFPLPPTSLVSAWQAVMRAQNLSRRGKVR